MTQHMRVVCVTGKAGGLGMGVVFPAGTTQGAIDAVLANVRASAGAPSRIYTDPQLTPPRWYVWWEAQVVTANTRGHVLNILGHMEDMGMDVRDTTETELQALGPNVLQALPLVFR